MNRDIGLLCGVVTCRPTPIEPFSNVVAFGLDIGVSGEVEVYVDHEIYAAQPELFEPGNRLYVGGNAFRANICLKAEEVWVEGDLKK